jgi:hypothetical protein
VYTSQKIATAGKFTRLPDIGSAHGPASTGAVWLAGWDFWRDFARARVRNFLLEITINIIF